MRLTCCWPSQLCGVLSMLGVVRMFSLTMALAWHVWLYLHFKYSVSSSVLSRMYRKLSWTKTFEFFLVPWITRKFWPSLKLGFELAVEVFWDEDCSLGDEVEVELEVPGEDMLVLQRSQMKWPFGWIESRRERALNIISLSNCLDVNVNHLQTLNLYHYHSNI